MEMNEVIDVQAEVESVDPYADTTKYFYSEELDVLVKPVGQKNDLGYVFVVLYSDNPAYTMPVFESVPEFLKNYFVECKYNSDLNEISYLSDKN